MPSTRQQQKERERARSRQQAAAAAADAAARRRRVVAGVVVSVALLATVGAFAAATSEDDTASPSSTSTAPTSSLPAGPSAEGPAPVDVALPAAGATLTGDTPCPPGDGTAERTTGFASAPPMCLVTGPDGAPDPAVEYLATIHTDAGELVYRLDAERSPQATNTFVALARYGYFDGAPLDTIVRNGWAEVGGAFDDGSAPGSSVGFTLATEAPEVGTIQVPGTLSVAPVPGSDGLEGQAGRYLIALGDQAADLPARTTTFGLLLDGTEAFPAMVRAGTESGQPGAEIVIERVEITEERDST